jgi:deoxycytidine triphosphate deaminase
LRPGMDIAQLLFAEMTSPPDQDYKKVWRYGEGEDNMVGYIKK